MHTRNVNQRQELRDLREHRRYAVAETFLRVIWLDAKGDPKMEKLARPIDVSETGMSVELPEAALLLSRIRLESDKGELLGQGKIRYCRSKGAKYIVGLEFTDSLRWRPPQGPFTEPIPLTPPIEEELTPANEPVISSSSPTECLEELLWSETLGTDGADKAFMPPAPAPHLSLDSGVGQGFLARLPLVVKAGAPASLALLLGVFLLGHGGTTSASSGGVAVTKPMVGEQGWITEWASDAAGSRRARQITLYRPSATLSDYQMQFTGQIESKALGWVFRARDSNNYYGMKIENDKPGSVLFTRFAVVNGRESSVTQKPLPIQARVDTAYNVKLEVRGPRFSVYIQGEPVDLWTDSRLKAGALGFMNEANERGRTNSVQFSF